MTVIDLVERARENDGHADIPFVETSVFRDLRLRCDLAIQMGWNAYFPGVPGTGKSRSAMAYVTARQGDVKHLQLTQTTSRSNKALMGAICRALGHYDDGTPREMERRILKSENACAVILDEGQYLDEERMDHLVHLSATDGGLLVFIVIGNPRLKATAETASGKHAGIARRFQLQLYFHGITQADADAIASAAGVEGMDAYRTLRAIGEMHHADGVVAVLRMARVIAAGAPTVNAAHVQQALGALPQYRPIKPKR